MTPSAHRSLIELCYLALSGSWKVSSRSEELNGQTENRGKRLRNKTTYMHGTLPERPRQA